MNAENQVFACRGEWSNGLDDTSAADICADGFHVWYVFFFKVWVFFLECKLIDKLCIWLFCFVSKNASEAAYLGLTYENCKSVINEGEIYFSKESSDGNYECQSDGYLAGINDVWGCINSNTTEIGGNNIDDACIVDVNCSNTLNVVCGNNNLLPVFDVNSSISELTTMNFYNSQYGGLLCCIDYIITDAPTNMPSLVSFFFLFIILF